MESKREIQRRTLSFAVRILKMVRHLPRDASGQMLARQLARSGTSIGANVEEAQGALSKTDFARRMNIAMSEARETLYWLRLAAETEMIQATRMTDITQEATEIGKILTVIVRNSRKKKSS